MREEYQRAVEEFYAVYRRLSRYRNIRMAAHTSLFDDGWIKVWEVQGDEPGKCICHVTDEDDTNLYRLATRDLKRILDREEKAREEKNKKDSEDNAVNGSSSDYRWSNTLCMRLGAECEEVTS